MKLVKTQIKVDIYGTEVTFKKPTCSEAKEYREKLFALPENQDATEVMKVFLVKMGLPDDLFEELEISHVSELMDLVTDSKKK